jgi:hypothetical protein
MSDAEPDLLVSACGFHDEYPPILTPGCQNIAGSFAVFQFQIA